MKVKSALIVFLLFLFFVIPSKALATRSIIITSDKSSLFGDEFATITASASGFTNGETIYIKGAFYQDGSTNYFGYTKNGDTWIKNGESTLSQRSISINNGDNILIVKSDFSDSGFSGEGTYKLKVGFYYITSGGNLSSVNWSLNSLDTVLNEPDPTPTLTPTSKPTYSPTPTITNIPIVTKAISKTPTLTTTLSPENKDVLGNATQSSNNGIEDSKKENKIENIQQNNNFLPIIFILIGVVFLLACVIVFFYPNIKNYLNNRNE